MLGYWIPFGISLHNSSGLSIFKGVKHAVSDESSVMS